MRALGEDPVKFRTLREELGNPSTVGTVLQEGFARRLARALWRVERADLKVGATEAAATPGFGPARADLKVGATSLGPGTVGDTSREPDEVESHIGGAENSNSAFPIPNASNPYPRITEAQWEARAPVRQLLENLLSRQVEIFDAQHRELMRQTIAGPSPHERAAQVVPKHPDAELMERMEDANCRQLLRMTSVLIRLRRQELQMEKLRKDGVSRDV